jgi:MoaA/NifB/PqqE/SkfB family radical SAM enzyme
MKRDSVLDIESFKILMKQFDEFKRLPEYEGKCLNITGGEPLIIPNILEYIDVAIESGVEKINFLTNGILFNEDFLKEIKKRKIVELQVSLEGPREINDFIRGENTFDKIINAIKLSKSLGSYIKVSCTLNSVNYKHVSETIDIVKNAGADMIWFDRMTPFSENNIKELTT